MTPLGKIVMLVLALGLAIGAWSLWQRTSGSGAGGSSSGAGQTQEGAGSAPKSAPPTQNHASESPPPVAPSPPGTGHAVDIPLITSATAKTWLEEQVARFNRTHGDQWHISTRYVETRDAMHMILDGTQKPVLWGPSSPIWSIRLAEAWTAAHKAGSIVDTSDPDSTRVFLRSPIVFLTSQEKAAYLRPLLGGAKPWAAIRALSLKQRRPPWGTFKFTHADPLKANSGMLTLGLILADYIESTGAAGRPEQVANSGAFVQYLQEVERSLVYDLPAQQGSSVLTRAFADDPSRYDLITTYESSALAAVADHSNLAVIYPQPTAVTEHSFVMLSADWVTTAQKDGAQAFMKLLGDPDSIRGGIANYLRPARASGGLSLDQELSSHRAQGFQTSFTSRELPPYDALNAAAYQWRLHVARQ